MSSLDDHPTVRRLRAGGAQESTVEQNPLNSGSLRRIALECGADDCGLVRIDDPALGEERDHVLRAFALNRLSRLRFNLRTIIAHTFETEKRRTRWRLYERSDPGRMHIQGVREIRTPRTKRDLAHEAESP